MAIQVKKVAKVDSSLSRIWRLILSGLQKELYILILVGLFISASFLSSNFLRIDNLVNMIRQASIMGIFALGATFIILTGGIDLSIGYTIALISILIIEMLISGYSILLTTLIAIGIGGLVGITSGLIIAKRKIQPFVVTLAMMMLIRGIAMLYTRGGRPVFISHVPSVVVQSNFTWIGRGYVGIIPFCTIIFLLIFLVDWFILRRTTVGRCIYSIGSNPRASFVAGIKVDLYTILVYIIGGFHTAIGSLIWVSRLGMATPVFAESALFDTIAVVAIGGTSLLGGEGGIGRTLVGLAIIVILSDLLDLMGVSSFSQLVAKGIIIFLAVWMSTIEKK